MKQFSLYKIKKGDITIETVVLVALALIFLVVVAFVMTGRIALFSKTLSDCENKEGICTPAGGCYGTESGFSCADTSQICCLNTCEGADGKCEAAEECTTGKRLYSVACKEKNQICCA